MQAARKETGCSKALEGLSYATRSEHPSKLWNKLDFGIFSKKIDYVMGSYVLDAIVVWGKKCSLYLTNSWVEQDNNLGMKLYYQDISFWAQGPFKGFIQLYGKRIAVRLWSFHDRCQSFKLSCKWIHLPSNARYFPIAFWVSWQSVEEATIIQASHNPIPTSNQPPNDATKHSLLLTQPRWQLKQSWYTKHLQHQRTG